MKNYISVLLVLFTISAIAQRRAPKMAPIYASGYYLTKRGDTIRGQIQTNVDDQTTFYKQFNFKNPRSTKPRVYNTMRAQAYGFDNRNFVMIDYKGTKMFVEKLAHGRLALYEYKFHGKINGLPAVESAYYVLDTWAENDQVQISKINQKFYKRSLKPFMQEEQPEIWEQLDKFNFDKQTLVRAIKQYNKNFKDAAN